MQPNATQPAKEQSYIRNASATKISVTKTITIPAGAAGAVVDFDFPTRPITSAGGADIGGVGDTSLVLGSSSTFDTLVNPKEDADLAQGEYYVNHLTGKARGCKKDSATSVSATFGVWAGKVSLEMDEDESVASETLQSAVSASGNGTAMNVQGMTTALLQVSGTFVGTVHFEGSIDGSTYVSLYATQVGSGSIATNTTTTGLFRLPVSGLKYIRARVAWTSGTSVTVVGRASIFSSATEEVMYAKLFDRIAGELLDRNLMRVTQCGDTLSRITTATTTAVLAEDGDLLGIFVEVALTGTVTVYNHPSSATGSPVLILPIGTPAAWYPFPKSMNQGVTVVTSASDRIVVIANT